MILNIPTKHLRVICDFASKVPHEKYPVENVALIGIEIDGDVRFYLQATDGLAFIRYALDDKPMVAHDLTRTGEALATYPATLLRPPASREVDEISTLAFDVDDCGISVHGQPEILSQGTRFVETPLKSIKTRDVRETKLGPRVLRHIANAVDNMHDDVTEHVAHFLFVHGATNPVVVLDAMGGRWAIIGAGCV